MPEVRSEFGRNSANPATAAEAMLWTYIQDRKLLGKKFRRQSSVGPYIVDFYCPGMSLNCGIRWFAAFCASGVEEYEKRRTEYLEDAGLKILRFENRAIRENIEFVLETIKWGLSPN